MQKSHFLARLLPKIPLPRKSLNTNLYVCVCVFLSLASDLRALFYQPALSEAFYKGGSLRPIHREDCLVAVTRGGIRRVYEEK